MRMKDVRRYYKIEIRRDDIVRTPDGFIGRVLGCKAHMIRIKAEGEDKPRLYHATTNFEVANVTN